MPQDTPPREPTDTAEVSSFEHGLADVLATMGVTFLPEDRRIEIAGRVNMQEGLIEVFACAPGGKLHETVVVLECYPSGVHAGLLALGLEPGRPVAYGPPYQAPDGPGVITEVRYQLPDGSYETMRAEDWLWNPDDQRSMRHVAWLFTGSYMDPNMSPEGDAYAADYVKSIITTYHDPSTVLENPLMTGQDDTIYYANTQRIPPIGTPVTVMLRPATTP